MGIFSGLFRSRDKPQNRTTGSTYSFFFGSRLMFFQPTAVNEET